MKWRNVLAASVVALVLALPAMAEEAEDDEWIRGRLFGPELILQHRRQLKLTAKQLELIGVELKRVQGQAAESDWQLLTEATQIQELIELHPVDREAVMAGIDRLFDAENRKKRLFIEMLVNVKNALTPEQVAYLKSVDRQP